MASRLPLSEFFHSLRHITKHLAITKQLQNPSTSRALAATATLASATGSLVAYWNMNRHQEDLERRVASLRERFQSSSQYSDTDAASKQQIATSGRKMQSSLFLGNFFSCMAAFFAFYMLGRWRGTSIAQARFRNTHGITQSHAGFFSRKSSHGAASSKAAAEQNTKNFKIQRNPKVKESLERLGFLNDKSNGRKAR